MQSSFLLFTRISSSSSSSSSAVVGGVLSSPKQFVIPHLLLGYCGSHNFRKVTPAAASAGEQDHYAILGISRSASAAQIKQAYRLLARKYHPDVCKDIKSGELFKSIRFAYEVLSDEVLRAKYDRKLMFPGGNEQLRRRKWTYDPDSDDWRAYRWAELKRRTQYEDKHRTYSGYDQEHTYQETSIPERRPFSDVLRFAFMTLFFMQTLGHRASLTLCGLAALLDKELDGGFKMGYFIAWLLGGSGGILLSLCIHFASWLCGKNSSGVVVLVVVAMWVGAYLARFAPIPQGAVLTLLYMSIKLHLDSK